MTHLMFLFLCSEPIEKMSLVRCYPIGVIIMTDRNEKDEKIIAIPFGDPQYNSFKDIHELPKHISTNLHTFLRVYKELENKSVHIEFEGGAKEAKEVIKIACKNTKRNLLIKTVKKFNRL